MNLIIADGFKQADEFIKKFIELHKDKRFEVCWDKFKNHAKQLTFKDKFIKKVIKNRWACRQRKLFQRWKDYSEKMRVIEECNDWGLQRIETNKIERDVKNLRELLKKDGFTEEEISAILKNAEDKYKN